MYFQNDGKTFQATKCIKSRIITKMIDSVFSIDAFEKQCVALKDLVQPETSTFSTRTLI